MGGNPGGIPPPPMPPIMEPGEMHIPTPVEKRMGGATIFVMDVGHFEQI